MSDCGAYRNSVKASYKYLKISDLILGKIQSRSYKPLPLQDCIKVLIEAVGINNGR